MAKTSIIKLSVCSGAFVIYCEHKATFLRRDAGVPGKPHALRLRKNVCDFPLQVVSCDENRKFAHWFIHERFLEFAQGDRFCTKREAAYNLGWLLTMGWNWNGPKTLIFWKAEKNIYLRIITFFNKKKDTHYTIQSSPIHVAWIGPPKISPE